MQVCGGMLMHSIIEHTANNAVILIVLQLAIFLQFAAYNMKLANVFRCVVREIVLDFTTDLTKHFLSPHKSLPFPLIPLSAVQPSNNALVIRLMLVGEALLDEPISLRRLRRLLRYHRRLRG